MPLMNIMGVLSQQHTIQQEGPPGYQLLKAGQSEFQVYVIWKKTES